MHQGFVWIARCLSLTSALLVLSPFAAAAPGAPPQGYLLTKVSSGIASSSVANVNQLAFKPGDDNHVYASRGFSGVVTRYDYNLSTGQLSSPVDIVNLNSVSDGLKVISGIGFHGNDLWITRWPGWVVPRPATISRLRDGDGNGSYETRNDYLSGMNLGIHTISQVQIRGNQLFTGLGTQTNRGDPSAEQVYHGTIVRIADLNNPAALDLSTTSGRNTFADGSVLDGRPRKFAGGFRNPFGLRMDGSGELWVADNGADTESGFPETPDLLYRDVDAGESGRFPPPGYPGAPASPIQPLANLGSHVAPAGFDFLRSGPDQGNVLIALSSSAGKRLALVDRDSGAVSSFITGFNTPTDVLVDPAGRMLIADHSDNAVYLLTPPPQGDANRDRAVNVADLGILATNWQQPGDWSKADFNDDGSVNVADLGILASNWQTSTNGPLGSALESLGLPAANVPEPAGLLSMAIASIAATARRPVRNGPGRSGRARC